MRAYRGRWHLREQAASVDPDCLRTSTRNASALSVLMLFPASTQGRHALSGQQPGLISPATLKPVHHGR